MQYQRKDRGLTTLIWGVNLVVDLGDPNGSFAGFANREPKDPSDLHQVFHGSGAEFTTGDSVKRLRE